MRRRFASSLLAFALVASALTTFAETSPAPRAITGTSQGSSESFQLEELAAQALFFHSDLNEAERLAGEALQLSPASMAANFVLMEAAALRGDEEKMLDAALAICEADAAGTSAYARIAAARIRSAASASSAFRARIPKLRLLAGSSRDLPALRLALVEAAANGAPELEELQASRDSGLLTDWRIVGPFGTHPFADFDRQWAPERDGVSKPGYSGHKVEVFQFPDGQVKLPSYLAREGVFYGSSQFYLRSDGDWRLFLESGGTLEIYIDGKQVLARDDRRGPPPQSLRKDVKLSRGDHQLMVKFLTSAVPFRLAIMAPTGGLRPHPNIPSFHASDSGYVIAALHYWEGDLTGSVEALGDLLRTHPSASAHLLLARAWTALDENAPEQLSEYEAALKLAPAAAAAEVAAGEIELRARRIDSVLRRLARLLPPASEGKRFAAVRVSGALELFIDATESLGWEADEEAALRVLAERSAACKDLRRAADFFLSRQDVLSAGALEPRLEACDPLAFARLVASSGDHRAAADAAAKAIQRNPIDRSAREFQVRQLMLAGLHPQAASAARELAELAPNSELYRELSLQVASGATVFSRNSAVDAFYRPYRRDGPEIAHKTAAIRFAGGPAAILLNDRIVDVQPDGSRRVYVHILTRVLTREGIERYGEVALPPGASLLELRTLKADGSVLEPELTRQKQTITMPALAPGDVIEQEFVIDRPDAEWNDFTFASRDAPTVSSRLILISPEPLPQQTSASPRRSASQRIQIAESGAVAKPTVSEQPDGRLVRTWEQNDLRALSREKNLPEAELFPAVHLSLAENSPALPQKQNRRLSVTAFSPQQTANQLLPGTSLELYARDCSEAMREAAKPGVRTVLLARSLTSGIESETQKARVLASWVRSHVQSDGRFDCAEVSSAEDTLSSGQGSRSAAFLALAQASGINAGLALARKIGADELPRRFAYPLLELGGDGAPSFIDVETENAAFGMLPAALDRSQALRLQLESSASQANAPSRTEQAGPGWFTRISPLNDAVERSRAEGTLTLTRAGDLRAELLIRLGVTRAAQLRGTLRGSDSAARRQYLVQLASRILPGATDVSGSVENLEDNDGALAVRLRCRVPEFLSPARTTLGLEQFLPGVGLQRTHAASPVRSLPMLMEDVLVESARFTVRLPAGVSLLRSPGAVRLRSRFGEYRLEMVKKGAKEFEIIREFNIPVQLVPAGEYLGFRAFALRIDQVEREQLTFSWPEAKAGKRIADLRLQIAD